MNVLIFPCNIESASAFVEHAQSLGANVIYASSIETQEQRHQVHHLPYVNAPEFADAFLDLINTHEIAYVYAAHDVVLQYLHRLKNEPSFSKKFMICNDYQHKVYQAKYEEALQFGADVIAEQGNKPGLLSVEKYAHLYMQFNAVPGQSDNAKLKSLIQLFIQVEQGDVVEIGSYWGRSAYALGFLANQHGIGTTISVDPWDVISNDSQGEGTEVVNEASRLIDWDLVFRGFIVNVSGLNNINYIRKPSDDAVYAYQQAGAQGSLTTPELGTTPLSGTIALLHIDGNHMYEQVKRDIDRWLPHVKPGGWVLVDDYDWSFGDGPKKAGDELLNHARVSEYFFASDTLFIRL